MTLSDLIGSYDHAEFRKIDIEVCNDVGEELEDWTMFETELVKTWWFDTEENKLVILLEVEEF